MIALFTTDGLPVELEDVVERMYEVITEVASGDQYPVQAVSIFTDEIDITEGDKVVDTQMLLRVIVWCPAVFGKFLDFKDFVRVGLRPLARELDSEYITTLQFLPLPASTPEDAI